MKKLLFLLVVILLAGCTTTSNILDHDTAGLMVIDGRSFQGDDGSVLTALVFFDSEDELTFIDLYVDRKHVVRHILGSQMGDCWEWTPDHPNAEKVNCYAGFYVRAFIEKQTGNRLGVDDIKAMLSRGEEAARALERIRSAG